MNHNISDEQLDRSVARVLAARADEIEASAISPARAAARLHTTTTPAVPGLVALAALVALLAAAMLAAMWAAVGQQPKLSPAHAPGGIVFARGGDLYVAAPDGSGERLVDRGSAAEGPISALAAAPGGRTIAVQRGGATILMVSVGGVRLGSFTPVSDSVAAFDWAPDGQRLAVRTGGGGTPSAIAIVGLDGRTEVSLPLPDGFGYQTSGGDTGPLWSPDGRWLAVVGCQACDTKVEAHILLVAAEGSGYHWMSDNSAVVDYSMAWSTNSLIAIGRWGAKPVSVAILSTDGSLVRDATLPDSLGPELLAWSPDGTTLAVMGWPVSFSPPAQLVVIPPDRDATVIPTNLQGVSGIRWLSDGTRILYAAPTAAGGPGSLWAVESTGGAPMHLIDDIGPFDTLKPPP